MIIAFKNNNAGMQILKNVLRKNVFFYFISFIQIFKKMQKLEVMGLQRHENMTIKSSAKLLILYI